MRNGDTVRKVASGFSDSPLGYVTAVVRNPEDPDDGPETQNYGVLGTIGLDGNFSYILRKNWEVVPEVEAQALKLHTILTKWRDTNGVWNGEVIALYDHVRETFDDLIFEMINVIGYAPYVEDEED